MHFDKQFVLDELKKEAGERAGAEGDSGAARQDRPRAARGGAEEIRPRSGRSSRRRPPRKGLAKPLDDRDNREVDTLEGQLLIASPALLDPNFRRTVVLITEHSNDGAAGLVLNRPSPASGVGARAGARAARRGRGAGLVRRPGAAERGARARRVRRSRTMRRCRSSARSGSRRSTIPRRSCRRRRAGACSPATPAGARASSRTSSAARTGSSRRRRTDDAFTESPERPLGGRAPPQGRHLRARRADPRRSVGQLSDEPR